MSFASGTARAGRQAFDDDLAVRRDSSLSGSSFFLFFILLGPDCFRTGLEEPYLIGPFIDAPFHIHVAAVMFFNGFGICSQFFDLFVRNDLLFLQFRRNEFFFAVAARFADQFDRFGIDHLGEDSQVIFADFEVIRRNRALYDVFAEAPGAFDGNRRIVARDQVDREHDAGGFGEDHHLDGGAQSDGEMIEALFRTIVRSAVRKGRCITFLDLLDDHVSALDVEVRVLLAGKAGIGQIFRCCTGTDGDEGIGFADFLAQFFITLADVCCQISRHFSIADCLADLSRDIAELDSVFDVSQAFQQFRDGDVHARFMHEMTIAFCRRRKPIGNGDIRLGCQFTEGRRFPAYEGNISPAQFIEPQYICFFSVLCHNPYLLLLYPSVYAKLSACYVYSTLFICKCQWPFLKSYVIPLLRVYYM